VASSKTLVEKEGRAVTATGTEGKPKYHFFLTR